MIKKAIAPIQAWLLSQSRCVGCGKDLSTMKTKIRKDKKTQVNCECKRVYIKGKNGYRRAVLSEIE